MKAAVCCLNSKYIHSSTAPWCLFAGVRAYCTGDITAEVIEGTVNEPAGGVFARIVKSEPDVVGFCTYIWNVERVLELASRVKKELPGVIVALGGPEAGYRAESLLSEHSEIDAVISGEGEEPFAAFLQALYDSVPPETVQGVCCRTENGLKISEPYVSHSDPVSPYCEEYFRSLNGRIAYLETSRGCPFSCAYCLSGRCGGVRFFDLENAKKNILRLAQSGAKTVKFVDRTFNADKKRACEIFSFIKSEYSKGIPKGTCFHFEIAGDILDEAQLCLLETMPKGSVMLEIGIQSFNEKTLETVNRKTDIKRLCENIKRLIAPRNIHVHIDLIAGLPYEDFGSFCRSFNIAFYLGADMLQFGFLKLLYGSPMREQPQKFPCEFSKKPPYEVISTPWLTVSQKEALKKTEQAFDSVYNSGRFRRTVKYALEACKKEPYSLFSGFADYLENQGAGIRKMPLDRLSDLLFDYLCSLDGVNRDFLRDAMICDRLATNSSGFLPLSLYVKDEGLNQVRKALSANPKTAEKPAVKRSVAILYGRGEAVYADYTEKDPVTGEYRLFFTDIQGRCK